MSDQKPPRLLGADERETLRALVQYQRDSVVRKFDGLTEEQARSSPVPSGISLLWIVDHLAWAERLWIVHRFERGTDLPVRPLGQEDTIDSIVTTYRATWVEVDAIADTNSLDEPCRHPDWQGSVDLRWVLMHLLEETARHAGHADIVRELIDGSTGR